MAHKALNSLVGSTPLSTLRLFILPTTITVPQEVSARTGKSCSGLANSCSFFKYQLGSSLPDQVFSELCRQLCDIFSCALVNPGTFAYLDPHLIQVPLGDHSDVFVFIYLVCGTEPSIYSWC